MNAVNLVITADGQGAIQVLQKTENAMKTLKSSAEQLTSALPSLNGTFRSLIGSLSTLYASFKAFETLKESATLAARVETLGIVMQTVGKNAGYSKAEVEAYSEGVRKMGITTQEAQQSIIRMMQAHLDLTKSQELARVAQDAAVIGNINSSEALQRLMHGIITLQPEILRTVGITVEFESAYKKFAESAGRTAESLSSQEKQQIALNLVLERGKDIAGSYGAAMGTVGKLMTSLPRFIEEVKLKFGELFSPALGILVEGTIEKFKSWERTLAELKASGDIARWADNIKTGFAVAVGSIDNLWKAAKTCVSIIYDLKEALIAASVAIGSYYTAQMIIAAVQTGKLITQIKDLITVVEILAYRSFTALLTPAGLVAAALGALTYVTINHYQEQRAAELEMENFKKSLSTFSADAKTQEMIDHLEILALEIEAVGGRSDETRQKIEMLKRVMSGGQAGTEAEMWKGIVHYGDIGGGKPLPAPTPDLKKIKDTNKRIEEEIAKLTMTEIEYIHHRAKEFEKEGADKVLVSKWTTAQLAKYWAEYDEKSQERIKKAYEEEQKLADKIVLLNLQTKNKLFDLDAEHQAKQMEWSAKAGLLNEETLARKKNELQIQALKNKEAETNLALQQLGYAEDMLYPTERMLELLKDKEVIVRQILHTEESLAFEIFDIQIAKQKELNDLLKQQADNKKKGYDDTWAQMMDMANQVGGEAGVGLGKLGSSLKGIADIGMGKDAASQRYQAALEEWNAIKALNEQGYIDEFTQLQSYNQMKLAEEQMHQQQRLSIISNSFGMMAGAAQAFYALSGQQNKTFFNVYKAFAIAQTTIDTYQAAVAAYKAMAGIPIVGPALATAAAAAAIAFGMARVAAIASMQPGGGAATAAVPSGGGGYSYSTPTTNTWQQTEKTNERPLVVNVYVSGATNSKEVIISDIIKTLKSEQLNATVAHSGWFVGSTPQIVRSVPSYIFNTAPRLHDGYDPAREYPAILEKGEIVIPNKVPAPIKNFIREIVYSETTQPSIVQMIDFNTAPRLHDGYDPGGYNQLKIYQLDTQNADYKEINNNKTINVINHFHISGNVVDHDAFAREMIPSIQKAVEDGMRVN